MPRHQIQQDENALPQFFRYPSMSTSPEIVGERQLDVLQALCKFEHGGKLRQAAIAVGVTPNAAEKWVKTNEEFAATVDQIREMLAEKVEAILYETALTNRDLQAIRAVLSADSPDRFGNKQQIQMDTTHHGLLPGESFADGLLRLSNELDANVEAYQGREEYQPDAHTDAEDVTIRPSEERKREEAARPDAPPM